MKKKIFCRVWTKKGSFDLIKKQWLRYDDNKLHRLDGPAFEGTDGTKAWYIDGELHRLDGPAYEDIDGTKVWWANGKMHCTDGPAYEDIDGTKEWWANGKQHRLDGPAIEETNGTKWWWIDGKQLPHEEVETWLKENNIDLQTQEGQMALRLRWS